MAKFSDITGRYVYLELDGVEYRVYIEEAGKGIPLVCQHTAGSDGRQYRHILEDRDITSRFHVIAADLPYHGKSLPPTSVRYWEKEYQLTKDWFMRYWVKLCRELELERPVYMGCSMGGHLAPDLALNYPNEFRACIGSGSVDVERQYRSAGEPMVPSSAPVERIEARPDVEPVLAERARRIRSRDGLGI